jgi:hypothetical protein
VSLWTTLAHLRVQILQTQDLPQLLRQVVMQSDLFPQVSMSIIKLGLDCPRGSIVFGLVRCWENSRILVDGYVPFSSSCSLLPVNAMITFSITCVKLRCYFTDDGQNAMSGKEKFLSKKATDNMGCSSREKMSQT